MAVHFDINVITVAEDTFTPAELKQVNDSVDIMRTVFATHGPVIATVHRFKIDLSVAGANAVIRGAADAIALADRFAVRGNEALDVFVVKSVLHPTDVGYSPAPGKCGKNKAKGRLRAPVVSLDGSTADSGNTFAHEVGHFLGLPHCERDESLCGPANFMRAQSGTNTGVTPAQAVKMITHCQVVL
ncbi:hypothetical protein OHT76_43570 [Streptomyces sp. NBC_00287]|uniref:hypothetical protein n=1 Tax=Streptomyces sp. NBC_00287 TaxID=2975702 RepID=UPI002E28A4F7|nr:hypothetical protein [Streptomyces sp. NBC_00287]